MADSLMEVNVGTIEPIQLVKPSLRKSINAMCKNCTYDPLDKGTWRAQVEACNITRCPLWNVRPKATKR